MSLHYVAINIYMPLPFSALQISDNTVQYTQQSMWYEDTLQDLYADSLPDVPSDCLDVSDSSYSDSGSNTSTPGLKSIPLTTNRSYDQNFLKKISVQTTIKISLKFHFEILLKLWTQSVD
jgi:hypothetical protein